MVGHQQNEVGREHRPFLKTPAGWIFIGALTVGAAYLAMQHTAHLFIVLPYLLVLACPLGHFFLHRSYCARGKPHDDRQGSDAGRDSATIGPR